MKTLTLTIALLMSVLLCKVHAQSKADDKNSNVVVPKPSKEQLDHLRIASNLHFTGLALKVGGPMFGLGLVALSNEGSTDYLANIGFFIIGAGIVGGLICDDYLAWEHIGRASGLLTYKIVPAERGLGLAFKF